MLYPVAEIFSSLQGEGHFVGYRLAFVRLAGCSVLECRIREQCDEAPWRSQFKLRSIDIIDRLKTLGPFAAVCITGGEPTDHDLRPLVSSIREAGWRVHLETSGVRSCEGYPLDWLTVSPKTVDFVQRVGHTLKLVVDPSWKDPWAIIKGAADCTTFFHYYLQPLTNHDGSTNVAQVIELLADSHNGGGKWALSTQAHRVWNLR
jgi:7-carboxy-7-deazaguanine synthase